MEDISARKAVLNIYKRLKIRRWLAKEAEKVNLPWLTYAEEAEIKLHITNKAFELYDSCMRKSFPIDETSFIIRDVECAISKRRT